MVDVNDLDRAIAYVQDIPWRLETLQSRSRYNIDTGELKRLPTRLRRFVNGIPQDNVAMTLAALEAMSPYKGVVYNGEDDLENVYRPTVTMIKKDQSLTTGADATYTIIQDLLLANEGDMYTSGDASSCSQVSESEYHWDEPDIMPCPDGGQGVSYQISNVQRSAENDLFSYNVKKTVAITQHMPETTTVCDDDKTTTVETWDNVYGEPGDFRWDPYRHDGSPIGIPDACDHDTGTTVQLQVQENPDCTFKVSVERTMSRVKDGDEYMRLRDQYRIQTMDLVSHAREPLPKTGKEYGDGVVTKYEVKENPDGTFENRTSVDTERPVSSSTVSVSKMPFSYRTERTDTNMPDPASGLPAGATYGSYEYTRTPGGLFTNKYVTVDYVKMNLGLDCKITAYQHDHSVDETVESLPSGHVSKASGGKITEIRGRVDGNGSVVRTTSTTTELEVEKSAYSKSVTPRGVVTTYTDTNVAGKASGLPSGAKFGTYKYTVTPGRIYVNEYTTFTPSYLTFGLECSKTIFQHEHTSQSTVKDVKDDVRNAGSGFTYAATYSTDDNGAVVKSDRYMQELPVTGSMVETVVTPRFRLVRLTDTNMKDSAKALASGRYGSYKATKTPGGSFVNEYVTYEPTPGEPSGKSRTRNVFSEEHVDVRSASGLGDVPEHVEDAGKGIVRRVNGTVDDNGVTTVQTTVTTERPYEASAVSVQSTPRATIRRITSRNMPEKARDLVSSVFPAGCSEERSTNPGDTVDVTTVTTVPNVGAKSSEACQMTIARHVHRSDQVLADADSAVPGVKVPVSAGGGEYVSEEAKIGDDGVKVLETTRTRELNHEYGSRNHEDAFQAYQIVDRTSDETNLGDPDHQIPGFQAVEDDTGLGSSGRIDRVGNVFSDTGVKTAGSEENRQAHMNIEEAITVARAVASGEFARGYQVMADSELTDGGQFHTKEYKYVAKPQKWKDYLYTDKYIMMKWTFRNLTQDQIQPLAQEICEECAKYNFGTFTAHPEINRNLNEFGLYDGTVSFTASSPQDGSSRGGGQATTAKDEPVEATPIVDWWEKSMNVTPLGGINPVTNGGETPWFKVDTEWRHLEYGWGRGIEQYRRFIQNGGSSSTDGKVAHSFWADSRHSYNVDSQKFTYLIVTERKLRTYVVKGGTTIPEDTGDSAQVWSGETEKFDDLGSNGKDDTTASKLK